MTKSEDVKNFSDFYLLLPFNLYCEESVKKKTGSDSAFVSNEHWIQLKNEMRSHLSLFSSKDSDLQNYITSGKFVEYERSYYCRNYFILSSMPQDCENCSNNLKKDQSVSGIRETESKSCNKCCSLPLKNGKHRVLGYFSLALKTIEINRKMCSNKSPRIGKMMKKKAKPSDHTETYLIGHLSKNFLKDYDDEISGKEIFQRCLLLIRQANLILGSNIIRVDCEKGNDQLIEFYQSLNFEYLDDIPASFAGSQNGKNKKLTMMIRSVYN